MRKFGSCYTERSLDSVNVKRTVYIIFTLRLLGQRRRLHEKSGVDNRYDIVQLVVTTRALNSAPSLQPRILDGSMTRCQAYPRHASRCDSRKPLVNHVADLYEKVGSGDAASLIIAPFSTLIDC